LRGEKRQLRRGGEWRRVKESEGKQSRGEATRREVYDVGER
jgi:hypothetical protein